MSRTMPKYSQVVVIGGGVIGASVAYHLAELGCTDVLLLERGQLGCGTSWHAAGNVPSMDTGRVTTGLLQYSAQLYAQFEAQDSVGYRRCGRVMPARGKERMKHYEQLIEVARTNGLQAELLTPQEIAKRIPAMRTDDLVGVYGGLVMDASIPPI